MGSPWRFIVHLHSSSPVAGGPPVGSGTAMSIITFLNIVSCIVLLTVPRTRIPFKSARTFERDLVAAALVVLWSPWEHRPWLPDLVPRPSPPANPSPKGSPWIKIVFKIFFFTFFSCVISTCFLVPDLRQPHLRLGFARSGRPPPWIKVNISRHVSPEWHRHPELQPHRSRQTWATS